MQASSKSRFYIGAPSWQQPRLLGRRYHVVIVCEATGIAEVSDGDMTFEQATELAEWFGTTGNLHAEVV